MSVPLDAGIDPAGLTRLRASMRGTVLLPHDRGYEEGRRVWNAMVDRRPAAIARCSDVEDVRRAIGFAVDGGLALGVRCGGHSVLGLSVPQDGLMLDLSPLNGVTVDPERRVARVGGGALLGDLDRASLTHGLATTAGNVSHTGVGGLTLGGGMGWLARRLGLACDNVIEFQVVSANGSVLTASGEENPDLYWALRGGGGNFGVVTEFTFRLHAIDPRVLSVEMVYAAEHAPDVLRAWREFAVTAPGEATPTAWSGTAGEWPFLPPQLHGRPVLVAGFVWVGDPARGRALVDELRGFGPVAGELIEEIDYAQLQAGGDDGMRHGLRRYWKGHYLRELSDGAIEAFLSRGGPVSDGEVVANGFLQAYGGAIADLGPDESAFSHRDARFEFVTMAGWEDPAEDDVRMAASRRCAAAMEPFASGVYVNGLADEGADGVHRAYQSRTLGRLTALKDRYDPANVFHLNHNIPPSGGS